MTLMVTGVVWAAADPQTKVKELGRGFGVDFQLLSRDWTVEQGKKNGKECQEAHRHQASIWLQTSEDVESLGDAISRRSGISNRYVGRSRWPGPT